MRFPGFDGEWVENKLGDIFDISAGGDIDKENVRDVKSDQFQFPVYANAEKNKGLYGYSNLYKINGNVITVAGRGVNIGIAHVRNHKFYPIVRLLVLQPRSNESVRFFRHQINKLDLYKESTGVPQLTAPQISTYQISSPSIIEQERIADFIEVIEERIDTQSKIIEELKVLKTTLTSMIFAQQLRLKDDIGNLFPDWQLKKLGDVSAINPKTESLPNSFIYIDLESVVQGSLMKEERITKEYAPSRAQRFLIKNDILFQMVRPYQKNNFYFDLEGDYVASTGYAQIRTSANPKFVFHYLHYQKFVDSVMERCTGTSYPAINSTELSDIHINLPILEEQSKIANFLSSINSKIGIETQLLQNLDEQKKYLLQNLFV